MQDKQMNICRIEAFDILRGVALMLIILFHASVYNFANIHKIDFANPPLIIILMSFMALWGGIFIVYSMIVNSLMALRRAEKGFEHKIFSNMALTGGVLLIFHYLLNIFMGRWNIDFINNRPDLTVVAGSLREMSFAFPHIGKFFEGSSLSTVGLNLIILSGAMFMMLRNGGEKKAKRNYLILWLAGFSIMALSFARVGIFPVLAKSIADGNYPVALFFSFFIANPYPLLPYLAYGIFGLMIGMMIYGGRKDLLKKIVVPSGIIFIAFGLAGMLNFKKTISTPDFFWFFKTNFELGLFLILLSTAYFLAGRGRYVSKKLAFIGWFSRVSLSIYMLETLLSELLRVVLSGFIPGWNQTINGCLAFGAFNIIVWIGILFLWRRSDFKYSLEYYWVKLSLKIGKRSTKLDDIS
ncbi:MAG: hypothetical protein WA093_03945 [Minisyncoccales bacterium]